MAYKSRGLLILEFKVDVDKNDIDKLLNSSRPDFEIFKEDHNFPAEFNY